MKRVVVTGFGLVTPLGCGVSHVWEKLLAGESGVGRITDFEVADLPVQIAGMVPRGSALSELDPDRHLGRHEQRRLGDFILYAVAAADEALGQANWKPAHPAQRDRTGVVIGSGIGGLPLIDVNANRLSQAGVRRLSPFFIPGAIINEAAAAVAMRYGFRGPNQGPAVACASGAMAISDAARMILLGEADVVVAGGSEGASRLAVAGFSIMRALASGFNHNPELASRPWDKAREGLVLAEGAGALVLEEREHALARGAPVLGELIGYGLSSDAYHMTVPDPAGGAVTLAMSAALARAKLAPDNIDYIHAHATSTQVGDPIELRAVQALFGQAAAQLSMSSSKGATGHALGAAGAMGAIFALLALANQVVPPTRNLDCPGDDTPIDLVPHRPRKRPIRYAMSNSFAFGGANVSLVFGPGSAATL